MYAYNPDRRGAGITRQLGLETCQLYPTGVDLNTEFLKQGCHYGLRLSRQSPIASIGSCFAREIKEWLQHHGYTFLESAQGPCTEAGSARYDRVYNTFTLRQEFERAFGIFAPEETCWRFAKKGRLRIMDPYRKSVAWDDETDMQEELAEHQRNVRKVFSEAHVLIITVGQAEIWYHRRDGYVYPLLPPADVFDPSRHAFRLSTYQENLDNLERVQELFSLHNPAGHILVTVSPVPLRATFRPLNSVVANSAGKAILRAAVDTFVERHPDCVTYFPAYEFVSLAKEPFEADNRHVKPEIADQIMKLFEAWFLENGLEAA